MLEGCHFESAIAGSSTQHPFLLARALGFVPIALALVDPFIEMEIQYAGNA